MKLGLYADPHFSQTSSIIVGRKGEFTGRLNNLIESFNWMNELFKRENVDKIVCLGDMTDKPNLTAEEITAMSRCNLNDHLMIVGNHCRSDKSGKINSLSTFTNVISEPCFIDPDCQIYAIPYNHTVVNLSEINPKPKIILSHNDIKGYEFGAGRTCQEGYEISDILENCELFINGHLHNGEWVVNGRIINLGTVSGMNFSSCGGQWEPSVAILDTETLEIDLYENPRAYRFKKVEFNTLTKVKGFLDNLPQDNYVIQVKVPDTISQKSRKLIDQCSKVAASRLITYQKSGKKKTENRVKLSNDQTSVYDKLKKFVSEQSPKVSLDVVNLIIDEISKEEEGAE